MRVREKKKFETKKTQAERLAPGGGAKSSSFHLYQII